jgi:hypothetical protein
MPTMNPVSIIAQAMRFSPQAPTSVSAIRWAAPLSTTSLPSIAPHTITIASDPRMSPMPLRTAPGTSASGMPSATAAPAETRMNARNGCTFAQATSTTRVAIATAMMTSGSMAYTVARIAVSRRARSASSVNRPCHRVWAESVYQVPSGLKRINPFSIFTSIVSPSADTSMPAGFFPFFHGTITVVKEPVPRTRRMCCRSS